MRYEDCTPTWVGILPMLRDMTERGGSSADAAWDQMASLADAADRWNDIVRRESPNGCDVLARFVVDDESGWVVVCRHPEDPDRFIVWRQDPEYNCDPGYCADTFDEAMVCVQDHCCRADGET